jgi:hypothetical protein
VLAGRRAQVCYITAEQFMNDLIWSIQKNRTYEFKNEYRNVDVLLSGRRGLPRGQGVHAGGSSTRSTSALQRQQADRC